jgi:hypothetical protein
MDNPASVRITKLGRAAIIHYVEEGGSYDFDAELGGGNVLLLIYAPRDDGEWARRLPWATGRRTEVLEEVARQVIRQEASGSSFVVHAGGVDILEGTPNHLTDPAWVRPLLLASIAYGVVGIVTARLSGAASAQQVRAAWRITGWLLALAVFSGHLVFEHLRVGAPLRTMAGRVAAAVALGALALAVLGPVRAYWGASGFGRAFALSIVMWPIVTGIPALLAALAMGWILKRLRA